MAANPASGGQGVIIACPRPTTTFVHVDINTFRDVVQRLTGPPEGDLSPAALASTSAAPAPAHGKLPTGLRKSNFSTSWLHERRQYSVRPKLDIVKPAFHHKVAASSPSKTGGNSSFVMSPLGTPSKTFSKLSIIDVGANNRAEEEKVIKEKRFYLHPSPRSKPGYPEPELLTLFPLTSPKLDAPKHILHPRANYNLHLVGYNSRSNIINPH